MAGLLGKRDVSPSAISPSIPVNGDVAEAAAVGHEDVDEPLIAPVVEPDSDAAEARAPEPGAVAAEPEGEESQVRKKRSSPQAPSAS